MRSTYAVPDTVWQSDNAVGVPTLALEAEAVDAPNLMKWGTQGRGRKHPGGTYHFYTDDYKFNGLWAKPSQVVQSGCSVAIEPNFSTGLDTPRAVALWGVYRKRWMACYWQSWGICTWVDVNVEPQFHQLNFLGVPREWRHYATKYQATLKDGRSAGLEMIEQDWAAICQHTGSEDSVLLVYGGRQSVADYCQQRGWLYIPDHLKTIRGESYGAR